MTLLSTTVATIASAPIVAWVFGRVSLVAPLTNLAANPLIALAQPMVFCALVVAPIAPLARLFADAAHPLLAGLDAVARVGAAAPGGAISVAPTVARGDRRRPCSRVAVIVACASREWIRPATIALGAAAPLAWMPFVPNGAGDVELHMIDVGQGDAVALRTPHAHWILFDAGGRGAAATPGRSTVLPYLRPSRRRLDAFVLSHPHTDHVGGAASVLRRFIRACTSTRAFPARRRSYRDVARRRARRARSLGARASARQSLDRRCDDHLSRA